ncbi:MAG: putative Fe-S cluster assembly protein SufT [Oceanospirillaceae bacterium]
MQQNTVVTQRECPARRVPSGQMTSIPAGQFINIKQDLGGNYTITWQGNMLRIDGTDAGAIGRQPEVISFSENNTNNIDPTQVWEAIKSVFDPEIPVNLVDLGLIYAVDVDQTTKAANITMTLTAPGCGMGPILVSDVEYRVGKAPNVEQVNVELVFDPPWHKDMMSEEAQLETGLFF